MKDQIRKLKDVTGAKMTDLARTSFMTRQYIQILVNDNSRRARTKLSNIVENYVEDRIAAETNRLERHIAQLRQMAAEFREVAENTPEEDEQSA